MPENRLNHSQIHRHYVTVRILLNFYLFCIHIRYFDFFEKALFWEPEYRLVGAPVIQIFEFACHCHDRLSNVLLKDRYRSFEYFSSPFPHSLLSFFLDKPVVMGLCFPYLPNLNGLAVFHAKNIRIKYNFYYHSWIQHTHIQ